MPSLGELALELASLAPLRTCAARPQKLMFRANRLYWLEGQTQELFFVELDDEFWTDASKIVPQRAIVIAEATTSSDNHNNAAGSDAPAPRKLTKEEELLRERQRTLVDGISWYDVRKEDGVVFFITAMALHVYHPVAKKVLKINDFISDETLKKTLQGGPCLNIQPVAEAPLGNFVCVRDYNVYHLHVKESQLQKADGIDWTISVDATKVTENGKENFEFGTADYIMQEEFDRYSGLCARGNNIVFLHTDSTMLNKVKLASENGGIEEFTFPRVGDPNARSSVAVYNIADKTLRCVPHGALEAVFSQNEKTEGNTDRIEYIPRFGFVNDETIYVELLDRRQETLSVVSFALSSLPVVTSEAVLPRSSDFHKMTQCGETGSEATATALWRQSIPWAWCEVTSALLLDQEPKLLGAHYVPQTDVKDPTSFFHLFINKGDSGGKDAWEPLTQGAFNVRAASVKRCVTGGPLEQLVFFDSNKAERLGNSLFSIDLSTRQLNQVTPNGEYVYSSAVNDDGSLIAYVSSTAQSLASLQLLRRSTNERVTVPINWALSKNESLLQSLVTPTVVTFDNGRGSKISAAVFLPPTPPPSDAPTSSSKKIPLMMYVYGGPHVQLVVENSKELSCNIVAQTLVRHGVAVAVVDNQMSNANSLADHSICKCNMGRFEVSDYIAFKEQLLTYNNGTTLNGAWIDAERIGVFGWSYGGYATLLCMSQASDHFKLGFAGAPVGDWRLYDTGYTERYMGLLEAENAAYELGRIGTYVGGFPDDLDRVFIAHGLLDENVHFSHSCDIVTALVAAGKPYQMLVYPGERHGLRQKQASRAHYDALLVKTILERL